MPSSSPSKKALFWAFMKEAVPEGTEKGVTNAAAVMHLARALEKENPGLFCFISSMAFLISFVAQAWVQYFFVARRSVIPHPSELDINSEEFKQALPQFTASLYALLPWISAIAEGTSTAYSASFLTSNRIALTIAGSGRFLKTFFSDSAGAYNQSLEAFGYDKHHQITEQGIAKRLAQAINYLKISAGLIDLFPIIQGLIHTAAMYKWAQASTTACGIDNLGYLSIPVWTLAAYAYFGENIAQRFDMRNVVNCMESIGLDSQSLSEKISQRLPAVEDNRLVHFLSGLWGAFARGQLATNLANTAGIPMLPFTKVGKVIGNMAIVGVGLAEGPERIPFLANSISNKIYSSLSVDNLLLILGTIFGIGAGSVQFDGRLSEIKRTLSLEYQPKSTLDNEESSIESSSLFVADQYPAFTRWCERQQKQPGYGFCSTKEAGEQPKAQHTSINITGGPSGP